MLRHPALWFLPSILLCTACTASAKPGEYTDPAAAAADPDFAIQGEYRDAKTGVQVIALGDGKFDLVVYEGGLPGDGWKRGDRMSKLHGQREGDKTRITGDDYSGIIAGTTLTLTGKKDAAKMELKRIERKSPTLGAAPPAGAVVLFDGSSAAKFDGGRLVDGKYLLAGSATKDTFGSYRLHAEFLLPYMPKARGQGRGNSGIYLHDCYECQVLDSFGLKGEDNECGGFYQVKEPSVNMCLPPLVWQTYDFEFTAPQYEGKTKKVNARVTVRHNGVVIHDNPELPHATPGRKGEGPTPRSIYFQGHGNPVYYRNLWVEEKK